MPCLFISVRFHEGRYHGRPDWPPSPARLFQALVAGVARGKTLQEEDQRALAWLEQLEAPIVDAPSARFGQGFKNFVPNNDLDSVGGDPARIGEIRTPKLVRPILFDANAPLIYVWKFDEEPEALATAQRICGIAEGLYQLGRGVDMAWARGEILDDETAEARLATIGGTVYRPGGSSERNILAVPRVGSIASLVERFTETRARIQILPVSRPGKTGPGHRVEVGEIFVQPRKARFEQVAYDSPPVRLLFDLVGARAPWRLDRIVELTEFVRDAAVRRLQATLPQRADEIVNAIVGRPDAKEADKAARLRITPLPSIGHSMADRAIRRVLVDIPPNCPLRQDDLEWAFSGLEVMAPKVDDATGEVLDQLIIVRAGELSMLGHFGVDDQAARLWRTVTPAVLPQRAARRRIKPTRRRAEAKGGAERADEEGNAVSSVIQALRHAGIFTRPMTVRVQREPFEAKGARAEAFAPATRFAKERLWHVEVAFADALRGPLILGDGRYLGLGLMRPVRDIRRDVVAFSLPADSRIAVANRADLLRAVRRALMALSRDDQGNVPPLFSGHESDGAPANSGRHRHVFLAAADANGDGYIAKVIVAAPWACDRSARPGKSERAAFDRVVALLETVRAGRLGVLSLRASAPDELVTGPARIWESHTNYRPTRHARRGKDTAAALLWDVVAECARRGLPKPEIELLKLAEGPKGGVAARLRLRFAVAVTGPVLLGRDSHEGGGLFLGFHR